MSGASANRHIPIDVRRRIGLSPGAVGGMWVRFGQDSPLDEPGGYRYEISPEDRDVLEQAIRDSYSPDYVRSAAARAAINDAITLTPGIFGKLANAGANAVMNFLGFGVRGEVAASGALTVFSEGYADDETAGIIEMSGISASSWKTYEDANGGKRASGSVAIHRSPEAWVKRENTDGTVHYHSGNYAGTQIEFGRGPLDASGKPDSILLVARGGYVSEDLPAGSEPPSIPPTVTADFDISVSATREYYFAARDYRTATGYSEYKLSGPLPMDGSQFDSAMPELEGMEPIGDLDPLDSDVTPAEMQDMIDAIKDSPYGTDFYEPPVDTQDPSDMPIPAPEPTPEPGAGEIPAPSPISPGAGGGAPMDNFTYDDTIGQSPLAEFGMPMGDDFFDPDTGQLGDAFRPGKPFQGNVGGTPFPGTINAVKPVKPPRGAGGGLSGPGGIPALDPPNADFTGTAPPFYGDTFRKDRCFNDRLVTDVVKILAGELGLNANNIYVTPGCDKRFTGCFKKGSSKFDAMWDLADRCGYGVFPGPGDGGTVEPVTPLPVHHGPYHELVDLFRFEPVYDDFETYAYVEVSRPHYPGKRGYSVVVPVNSVYSVSEDKVYTQIVGRNYPEADAMDRAVKLAENFRRRTMQIECAIPYDPAIKLRHQFRVQRPSYSFNANYMATTVRHDCNHEGYITVLAGTYLTPEESAQYA